MKRDLCFSIILALFSCSSSSQPGKKIIVDKNFDNIFFHTSVSAHLPQRIVVYKNDSIENDITVTKTSELVYQVKAEIEDSLHNSFGYSEYKRSYQNDTSLLVFIPRNISEDSLIIKIYNNQYIIDFSNPKHYRIISHSLLFKFALKPEENNFGFLRVQVYNIKEQRNYDLSGPFYW